MVGTPNFSLFLTRKATFAIYNLFRYISLKLFKGHLLVNAIVFLKLGKCLVIKLKLQIDILLVREVRLRAIYPDIIENLTILKTIMVVVHNDVLESVGEV